MTDHLLTWIAGLAVALVAATTASIAARVQFLPDVIDISIVPTGAGWAASRWPSTARCVGSTPTGSAA